MTSPAESFLFLIDGFQADTKQVKLVGIHWGGRFRHQILGLGCLRERDDLADGFFSREQRDDAVQAERDAAVRRRAVRKRVQEEAEAGALLLRAEPQRLEHAGLQLLLMNSNAAGAQFRA